MIRGGSDGHHRSLPARVLLNIDHRGKPVDRVGQSLLPDIGVFGHLIHLFVDNGPLLHEVVHRQWVQTEHGVCRDESKSSQSDHCLQKDLMRPSDCGVYQKYDPLKYEITVEESKTSAVIDGHSHAVSAHIEDAKQPRLVSDKNHADRKALTRRAHLCRGHPMERDWRQHCPRTASRRPV